MKTSLLHTIIICLLLINKSYALCIKDSTENYFHKDESIYLNKLELTQVSNQNKRNVISLTNNNKKTAQILRIAALPFFIAALITNNSHDLSRGFLIAGAGIELTSLYFELHHRRDKKLSFQHK